MEGERVVAEGAFKLDSALQIRGDVSLMTLPDAEIDPEGEDEEAESEYGIARDDHTRKVFRGPLRWLAEAEGDADKEAALADLAALAKLEDKALPPLEGGADLKDAGEPAKPRGYVAKLDAAIAAALKVSTALAKDDPAAAKAAAPDLVSALEALSEAGRPLDPKAVAGAKAIAETDEISDQREAFYLVSSVLVPLSRIYATALKGPFESVYCPMAFDDGGAHWLQPIGEVRNPYFGSEMLMCGAVEATVPEPEPNEEEAPE